MIAIGNDVVDLADEDCQGIEENMAFQRRVFSPAEIAAYEGETLNYKSYLWLLWSAKEAAYKAVKQIRPDIFFSPISYQVNCTDQTITYQDLQLHFTATLGLESIHTVAMLQQGKFLAKCSTTKQNLSYQVRQQCREMFSKEFQISPHKISLRSSVNRIPRLYNEDKALPYPVSLSHQGRFIASVIGLAK